MIRDLIRSLLALTVLLALMGCSTPPAPPEVEQARAQDLNLWREGAKLHIPLEYSEYTARLDKAREDFARESAKLPILISYKAVTAEFANVITDGDALMGRLKSLKAQREALVASRIAEVEDSLRRVDELSSMLNEKRLSSRNITKAEILIKEARGYNANYAFDKADKALSEAGVLIDFAKCSVVPLLKRYVDVSHINQWKRQVDETVAASSAKGSYAIIISKLDRRLILYKAGRPYKTFRVGIGRNGASDKLHSGDMATPEGRYYITKKNPRSRYYKAMLINYPNEDDRARFASAKRRGVIGRSAGIGGLVEIHGGGDDSMTYGCIALDNNDLDDLYRLVGVGTPVTIVGVTGMDPALCSKMEGI